MAYKIVQPVAWDYIVLEAAAVQAVAQSGCFVFGSLAARNPRTRDTLIVRIHKARSL